MKRRDVWAIGIVLLLAFGVAVFARLDTQSAQFLHIYVDGAWYGSYSLDTDQEIAIGETNICEIANGSVRMIQADCPDQVCVHTAAISKDGMTIVCLPNRVVLEIDAEQTGEKADAVDGVSS